MLSKKKKGVPPLNPLKPEKWFVFYKERFGHASGCDRGISTLETIGAEEIQGLKAAGKQQQLNAERRKLLTVIRGSSQYWATCDMKGDDNSIVLPVAYNKRPASAPKVINSDQQSQYSSRSAAGSRKSESFFPRQLQVDPQRDIQSARPLLSSNSASSFRSPTKLQAHGVRRPLMLARSGTDQSPPVREEENGKLARLTSHAQVKAKLHEFLYAGVRPSCSEESSSDAASDFSLDDKLVRHVPLVDMQARDYGCTSCSSSGSMSPLLLQSRFLDMRLQQNDVNQFKLDSHHHPRAAAAAPTVEIGVQAAGLTGLYNDGNTCYLNSCLQCLAHTLPLASAVLGPYSDQIQKKGAGLVGSRHGVPEREWASPADVLTYAFHHVVRDLWGKPPYSVTSANVFLQCVQAFAPQFAGSGQHDAQEVLRAILDGLHEALNRVKVATPYRDLYVELKSEVKLADLTWKYHKSCHDSIIHGIFCGQLQSTIECSVCHRKSHCFDPFMDLSLPLPKSSTTGPHNSRESFRNSMHCQRVTLQDCISEFGALEQLEGTNKYYCPNCKAPRTSTKKLSLFRLPPVLVLHIKRFYGLDRNSYTKDETPVYYPLKGLDLSNLMGSKARKMQGRVYDLYAVCCHMGSMGCGHYTAQCKNCDNNVWYCFNDSSVLPVQDAAVLTPSAYILFYQQRAL